MNEIKISKYRNLLVYKKGYSKELIKKTIMEEGLNGLRILANLPSERINDLDFLQEYDFLKGLDLTMYGDVDMSFLLELVNLEFLSIAIIGNNKIDLKNQLKLKEFIIWWRNNIVGLEQCHNLTRVSISEFNDSSLGNIPKIQNLIELGIKSSRINSLKGIDKFSTLKKLSLGGCKKLTNIEDVRNLNELAKFEITGCKKIKDHSVLSNLPTLKSITLNDCGVILYSKELHSLFESGKLRLTGGTKISGIENPKESQSQFLKRKNNLRKIDDFFKKRK